MITDRTIVLCGGGINYANLPVGTNVTNAMIPINGKPVIGWILDNLLDKGILEVTIVLREEDTRARLFIERVYASRIGLQIAHSVRDGTIIDSLCAALEICKPEGLTRIILGDTLIRDSFHGLRDFVYVATVEDSRRWCLALTDDDQRIVDYMEKRDIARGEHQALAGYYHICDGKYLQECIVKSRAGGESELSDVLRRYGAVHPLFAKSVSEWYDFGHIDQLVAARRRLIQPRAFNTLSINPVLNTITKVSLHEVKLQDELDWYLNLPDQLKVLTPRIVDFQRQNGHLRIVQEYYGYPTLAELFLYGDLHADTWKSILRQVLAIHSEFKQYKGALSKDDIVMMYTSKVFQRIAETVSQDPEWHVYLERETIVFNGVPLRNLHSLKQGIYQKAEQIAENARVCIIHGDLCFSNILFDLNNQIIRLIDPRGRFGQKGIYGDPRYDIAKLRHSVHEFYDYIVADMFDLREESERSEAAFYDISVMRSVGDSFDEMIAGSGYGLDEIKFIEGLLFISMLPLHRGHMRRQKMMYLTGLALLNEVL
jgi:dTDP-glucose pyrophosphorylase